MNNTFPRLQLKESGTGAARYLSGPHVHLGEVGKKSTTITILRLGSFSHPQYGRFEINRTLLDGMVNNFNAKTYGQEIFMDVGHEPQKGSAGDIRKLFVDGGRLRAVVEWTDYGIEAIKKRGFRYISADFIENWTDHEFEQQHGPVLFGAALVTRPHIKNMDPVQLSEVNGTEVKTFIHHRTISHIKTEAIKMKKLLEKLKAKFTQLKLSEVLVEKLLSAFESTAKHLQDNEEAVEKLYSEFESAGIQLAEASADSGTADINIQLGDISVAASEKDDIESLVAKQLAAYQADQETQQAAAAETLKARQKQFSDAINDAEGLSDATVKTLLEAESLITAEMTEDQVRALAEHQIAVGNKTEAQIKLSASGYQATSVQGTPHIQLGDDSGSLQLQETINQNLGNSYAGSALRLTEEAKLNPFARKVLQIFDHLNARRLHAESKQLAGGETNIGDTDFPVGVQRTVIREALSDLRILELVQGLTDPTAQATTQIPYEVRDTSQVLNDGVVFEGQGIPGASISQAMDLAYILPRKLAIKLSNEVIHFSRSSNINWDAYARNVESNARVMRELIARFIANEYQRASDAYLSTAVSAEDIAGQLDGSNQTIKTAQFPIVAPHQVYDLQGNAVGSPENAIALSIGGNPVLPYDGSNTQASGNYYRVTNYNLGYIQIVNELGVVQAVNSGSATIDYHYATNVAKFDLDVPGGTTTERHLNGLLQRIGARKAILNGDRFVNPDFMLLSPVLHDICSNAEQFTAHGKRMDADVGSDGDLDRVKGVAAFGTNAPGIHLGDERILIGQRGVCTYTIAKPFVTGTPFEAVDANGRPTGQKVAYGEEYSAVKVPTPIRDRLTSVLAYSFTGR